jgi:hypothetical protein
MILLFPFDVLQTISHSMVFRNEYHSNSVLLDLLSVCDPFLDSRFRVRACILLTSIFTLPLPAGYTNHFKQKFIPIVVPL